MRIKNNRDLTAALGEALGGETVDYKWELPADPPAAGESGEEAGGGGGVAAPAPATAGAAAAKPAEATVKSVKRLSLKSVADHVMFNLNRFEFDFESMQQAGGSMGLRARPSLFHCCCLRPRPRIPRTG